MTSKQAIWITKISHVLEQERTNFDNFNPSSCPNRPKNTKQTKNSRFISFISFPGHFRPANKKARVRTNAVKWRFERQRLEGFYLNEAEFEDPRLSEICVGDSIFARTAISSHQFYINVACDARHIFQDFIENRKKNYWKIYARFFSFITTTKKPPKQAAVENLRVLHFETLGWADHWIRQIGLAVWGGFYILRLANFFMFCRRWSEMFKLIKTRVMMSYALRAWRF